MAKKEVLKVEHVGMKFNLSQEKVDDLRDYLIKLLITYVHDKFLR